MSGRLNPYAPPAYNGLAGAGPVGFTDVPFDYIYVVTLTANQILPDQAENINTDADFLWRATIVSANTGVFSIRFGDSQGYYISNGYLLSGNFFLGNLAVPYPWFPELVIPAGGRIGIDIQDLSGNPNTIELTFRGAKRYQLPAQGR